MCGIAAVISLYRDEPPLEPAEVEQAVDAVVAGGAGAGGLAATTALNHLLTGARGNHVLVHHPELVVRVLAALDRLDADIAARELELESAQGDAVGSAAAEQTSQDLLALRDASWAIRNDRIRAARSVTDLAGPAPSMTTVDSWLSIHQALSALDRLEIRGRDSAGLHVFVWGAEPDAADRVELADRLDDPEYRSGTVRILDGTTSFVYKTAKEIGALGENAAVLRDAIVRDRVLRRLLARPEARISVLMHTRWASVGVVSEPNAHPVNSDEIAGDEVAASDAADAPYVVAALNGDVDNYVQLRADHGLRAAPAITTDAKVIPTLVSRRMDKGDDFVGAFRRAVSSFDGSIAAAAVSATEPARLALAQRGSGQGLYLGLAGDRYLVGSEPHALVEETTRYVRLDGEHGGQIVVVDGAADPADAVHRFAYDGTEQPIEPGDVIEAEMTTRDIDRGDAPHFFIKELAESPVSVHRTIRRRIVRDGDRLRAALGDQVLTPDMRTRLANGELSHVRVIGQGTAAIAGRAIASLLEDMTGGALDVKAMPATELSGFYLHADMSNTLTIAVSQSGTTNDTNVTVGLVRSRGSSVIAIVNRRGSDLTGLADGLLLTSDGRDLEMSVASTKAFYSQAAAGALLACEIAEVMGVGSAERRSQLLESLEQLPDAMRVVIESRPHIAETAWRLAPTKRYWTVVGNGPNKVAAEELRIKLSELCYKSISFDITEDKKHIDLSCEPLILVCAVGLGSGAAEDVAKEVATFHAHKSVPIVIIDDAQATAVGRERYSGAAIFEVPSIDPSLGFVLAAMAGHLFGYEAARAIDLSAQPIRHAREVLEEALARHETSDAVLTELGTTFLPVAEDFMNRIALRQYEGQLEPSIAVRLISRFRDILSEKPIDEYQRFTGKVAAPSNLLDDLAESLTLAIDGLTRPIDAIKHQAKTVTVGISRNDERLVDRPLVAKVLELGVGRDALGYRTLKVLAALDPAVGEVLGYTRYRIEGDVIRVADRGGIARDIPSRIGEGGPLTGTKHQVANNQSVLVARGRRDGRTVILVPEVKGSECTGITLLHVVFADHLAPPVARQVLEGYDQRYDRLVDWVMETEEVFDQARLGEVAVERLLIDPIYEVAELWRA